MENRLGFVAVLCCVVGELFGHCNDCTADDLVNISHDDCEDDDDNDDFVPCDGV